MIIENARYEFVNVESFDSVQFGENEDQQKTYLKVFFIDGLGKNNLVYAYVDKLLTKGEKFKIAKSLANTPKKFETLDEESLSKYLNGIVK